MHSLLGLVLAFGLLTVVWNQAHLHCIDILDQYYSCRYLYPIKLVKNPPFGPSDWYIFNGTLEDDFFQNVLTDTSTEAALDLFRKIAAENNASCTSLECNCTRSNTLDLNKVYDFYFANATYFAQVKSIISNATRNYTLLTPLQIYARTGQFYALFDATIYAEHPTLVSYCLANDFTFNRIYSYNETYECYASAYLKTSDNLFECDWSYVMFDESSRLAVFNKTQANFSALESYYSCRLAPVFTHPSCPIHIQRFIALNYVSAKLSKNDKS